MPNTLMKRDTLEVSEVVRDEAATLVNEACDQPLTGFSVMIGDQTFPVTKELSEFLFHVVERTAAGDVMALATLPEELTTTTAADQLGVSRPTLMKLVDSGELPAKKVGSHTRLLATDVRQLKARRNAQRVEAFDRLRKLDEELGETDTP